MEIRIDYDVIWCENNKMKFKQFTYDIDDQALSLTSWLPDDVYKFYFELMKKNIHALVVAGELKAGTGILRYSGADPIYDKNLFPMFRIIRKNS